MMWLLVLLFVFNKASAQMKLTYGISKAIFQDVASTIDSAFQYRKFVKTDQSYRGVRVIDKTGKYYTTSSWSYFDNQTPFVIVDKFPNDLNSLYYCDMVVVDSKKAGKTLSVSVFSLVNKSCNQIPVLISKEYNISGDKVELLNTKSIQVLDDWDSFR